MKIKSVNLRILCEYGKIQTKKNPYLDTFYAVLERIRIAKRFCIDHCKKVVFLFFYIPVFQYFVRI